MISNPEESSLTYCNAPLQHTAATHYCNTLLQHTQCLLTAAADTLSGLESQGICVNLLQHITATHTATRSMSYTFTYYNTHCNTHCNTSLQNITATHYCNTLNDIHMGPQLLTPGVVSNPEESAFKFVMIIVTLFSRWLCFIMHSKSLIR